MAVFLALSYGHGAPILAARVLLVNPTQNPIVQLKRKQTNQSEPNENENEGLQLINEGMILISNPGAATFSRRFRESVFMHNPISLGSFGSFSDVENKGFFNPHFSPLRCNDLIGAGRFPIPRTGYPVRPRTVGIFSISGAEKIPLLLPKQSFVCTPKITLIITPLKTSS